MKLTESQLISIIRESTERILNEIGYHEKQKRDQSKEEHEAWVEKMTAAKKRYQQEKSNGEKPSDSKAIDYKDYKGGKGGFPVMTKESTIRLSSSDFHRFIAESVKNVLKEMMLPDEGCCEASEKGEYKPKFVNVDSRVKGVGSSWYYGGSDAMSLDELQSFLDKFNAVAEYKGEFYDNVSDIPLRPARHSIDTFGMPTGEYIETEPTVTVVPKGTEWDNLVYSKRYKFPEDFKNDFMYGEEEPPERNWRKNL